MHRAPQEQRTYFVTAVTAGRRRLFQVTSHAELFVETLLSYRAKRKFELHAYVVMPDHVHLLVTPAPDVSLEKVVQLVKGGFSFRLKSKMDVWARGTFEKQVPDRSAYWATVKYIDENPVVERLVERAEEFEYSSARRNDIVDPTPPWFAESQG